MHTWMHVLPMFAPSQRNGLGPAVLIYWKNLHFYLSRNIAFLLNNSWLRSPDQWFTIGLIATLLLTRSSSLSCFISVLFRAAGPLGITEPERLCLAMTLILKTCNRKTTSVQTSPCLSDTRTYWAPSRSWQVLGTSGQHPLGSHPGNPCLRAAQTDKTSPRLAKDCIRYRSFSAN